MLLQYSCTAWRPCARFPSTSFLLRLHSCTRVCNGVVMITINYSCCTEIPPQIRVTWTKSKGWPSSPARAPVRRGGRYWSGGGSWTCSSSSLGNSKHLSKHMPIRVAIRTPLSRARYGKRRRRRQSLNQHQELTRRRRRVRRVLHGRHA